MRSYLIILLLIFSTLSNADSNANEIKEANIDNHKWKVVNFWAQWCAPCRKEIPELNELSLGNAEKSLQVLGVNFDDEPHAKTLKIAQKMGIEFSILTIEQVEKLNLQHPVALPCTYILSPDNKLLKVLYGEQTKDSLMKVLSEVDAKI